MNFGVTRDECAFRVVVGRMSSSKTIDDGKVMECGMSGGRQEKCEAVKSEGA